MTVTYDTLLHGLRMLRSHFQVLSGDAMGPSHATWQQVAADCANTLRHLADMLDAARQGDTGPLVVFPSFEDCDPPAAKVAHKRANRSRNRKEG